jgi:hypothetical protein
MTRTRKRIVELIANGTADADITAEIINQLTVRSRLRDEMLGKTEQDWKRYKASWTRKVRCIRLKGQPHHL